MEIEEFQKHILSRVQKLEKKSFDATFEENYSPRGQAEKISDGKADEHHIGKKSTEVLKQELDSHMQNYRETFTKEEEQKWIRDKQSLVDKLREATK